MNVVTISVDSTAIVLKTNCNQAARHFERKPLFFEGSTYDTKAGYGAEEAPVLRYVDDRIYHMDFDREQRTLTVSAPWSGRGSSQLLRRSLWLLAEYVRQERGEYTFHASAISNGDLGTVFLAPSEAGKTTLVLELCLHHGFQLIANDQVRLGLRDGRPTILGGDRSMNLRLASLSQYSSQLAQRVFGDIQNYPFPWLEKKRVAPAELGLRTDNSDERTLDKVIFAKLDARATKPLLQKIEARSHLGLRSELELVSKINLFDEMSQLIRGAAFAPFDDEINFVPIFVPSLDWEEFLHRRIDFLNRLLERSLVLSLRGTLKDVTQAICTETAKA